MDIQKTTKQGHTTFALRGRLDTITAPKLQTELIPEYDAVKSVTLDFSQLNYVSSAGLRVLLMGEKTAKAKGAEQTLTGVSAEIMEIFDMTGFSEILNIE